MAFHLAANSGAKLPASLAPLADLIWVQFLNYRLRNTPDGVGVGGGHELDFGAFG